MASSVRRRGRPGAAPGCHLVPVRWCWPHSSGHRCRHGRHATPALAQHPPTRSASLSRVSDGRSDIHCHRKLRELLAPSPSRRVTSSSVSESAFFSTSRLPEISSRWAAFLKFSVVGFAAVATPTPANLAVAPSLPPFFCRGLCHTIPSLVAPSSGNTAVVPPRSPPTTTLHVSRLTGAVRVRPFYLGSSALSHRCLSRPSPTLYRSEMAGVSRDSSAVPPWPTATSFCCSSPWTTYLYRRGMTQGARWCPWIHRRSSPSASIHRRVCLMFSVSLTRGSHCQWPNGSLLSFI